MAPHAGGTLQGPDKPLYCSSDLTEWGENHESKEVKFAPERRQISKQPQHEYVNAQHGDEFFF